MAFHDAFNEREARRQFVHRRQKMVFTVTISALVVIFIVALVYTLGAFGSSSQQTKQAKPNYGVAAPCAPANTNVLNHPEVRIRVLNGTNKSGLGGAVMKALRNRGFNMQGAADFATKTELARTEIRFGARGIAQGYTVAEQFSDAILRMDDRQDDLVDVVIGATFNDLIKEKQVTGVGKPVISIKGCVADPSNIKDLPKFE